MFATAANWRMPSTMVHCWVNMWLELNLRQTGPVEILLEFAAAGGLGGLHEASGWWYVS